MTPTMNLRFVERETTTTTTAAGQMLPDGIVRNVALRVLQQEWASPYVGVESQWRDVPLVDLGA